MATKGEHGQGFQGRVVREAIGTAAKDKESRLDLATMSTLKLKSAFDKGVAMQEFEIQSMTCGHCASRVAQVVRNLDTQARIEVDLRGRRDCPDAHLTGG
jgi:hypothetical protein